MTNPGRRTARAILAVDVNNSESFIAAADRRTRTGRPPTTRLFADWSLSSSWPQRIESFSSRLFVGRLRTMTNPGRGEFDRAASGDPPLPTGLCLDHTARAILSVDVNIANHSPAGCSSRDSSVGESIPILLQHIIRMRSLAEIDRSPDDDRVRSPDDFDKSWSLAEFDRSEAHDWSCQRVFGLVMGPDRSKDTSLD
ncbi:hypothetical protein CBR_g20446 [Chara braunii]|uniref:Uncharacterized protein n=1 Tax=Chara braunii TaxID=69332 RepID=A0A388JUF3_CHABU|nr:hypothetical protein CBR_g20446 [Chara braunii]|eukprot:GBG61415.1 hypothetical protein CBR_g20446 [Chara braunii]